MKTYWTKTLESFIIGFCMTIFVILLIIGINFLQEKYNTPQRNIFYNKVEIKTPNFLNFKNN